MIDLQIRIHDKFSLEFKVGFHIDEQVKTNEFALNMWIFVPNSLDINSDTYPKRQFYRDMKSNVRLITPVFLLRDIAGGNAVPLDYLRNSFINLATDPTKEAVAEYEYQIKMFMAIFKSSVREEINHILCSPLKSDLENVCREYVDNARSSCDAYRGLRHIINVATVPTEKLNYYMFGDEFMSNIVENYTFDLIAELQSDGITGKSGITAELKQLIREEVEYQRRMGYPVADKHSPTRNREIVLRQSVLKKYIESDLFLKASRKRDAVVAEQFYLSIAAGVSMIFATAIAFSFQQKYGNFTMPLFVALVVSYMLKDRIKDGMRSLFAHRLGSKYFDNKTTVGIKDDTVGWIKDGVDFISDEKTPAEVIQMRNRSPLLKAENRINDEKIILYRKLVQLETETLKKNSEYILSGINEIMRMHLTSFIQKTDNPDVPLSILGNDGEIDMVWGEKAYFLNIVIQIQHLSQTEYRHVRLVFNREGIIDAQEMG